MVAIVIIGLITVPVTSGMLVAIKTMARTEKMMNAQLAVSSAVETLMAEGITAESDDDGKFEKVTVKITQEDASLPYYNVTVTSDEDSTVTVETVIRKAVAEE